MQAASLESELRKRSIPYRFSSGGRELTLGCPFCEKGNGHHLYINVNDDSNVGAFICFRCAAQGAVNEWFLRKLLGNDFDGSMYEFPKHKLNLASNNILPEWKLSEELSEEARSYIEKRLGITLSDEDVSAMIHEAHIIGDPMKFVEMNELYISEMYLEKMKRGVCFLSSTMRVVFVRFMRDDIRWTNIKLAEARGECYVMKAGIDPSSPVNIVIAEGIFDILSIRYNEIIEHTPNTIYISACGYTKYRSALNYMLRRGIYGDDVIVHLYIDSDKTRLSEYKRMLQPLQTIFGSISLYKNSKASDFGVPKDMISVEFVGKL